MDLISAVEQLEAIDHAPVAYNPKRCLLAIDKFSNCERCVEVCPVQAIQPGSPPNFQSEACTGCLACLPICPSAAFAAKDELKSLLTCLSRINNGPVEILCSKNPHVDLGISANIPALGIKNCLAGIGTGGFLAMAALGIDSIFVRNESCQDCPFGRLSSLIELQIEQANQILQTLNQPGSFKSATFEELLPTPARRIWDADNPPLSRRDLFHMITSGGKVALAQSLALENQRDVRQPGMDQRRMVTAIRLLGGESPPGTTRLEGLPFATIRVSSACTACGTCVRSCPNGALEMAFDEDQQQFLLAIRPADCNGCAVCSHVCGTQAIEIEQSPAFQEIFTNSVFRILSEGKLQRCKRCSQLFAPANSATLCPVCEYRRSHPFSVGLPPNLRVD